MKIFELIRDLHQQGVKLVVVGGKLRCSAPKGILSTDLLNIIEQNKDEILNFLQNRRTATHLDSIDRVDRGGRVWMSFGQQRLWYLEQLEPGTGVYNIPVVYRFRGVLDVEVMRRSLQELVDRHEVLRTRLVMEGFEPLQVIEGGVAVGLPVVDLVDCREGKEEELDKVLRSEGRRSFDLERGPLIRALLVRLEEEDHVLVLVMHHAVSDGWSVGIMLRELVEVYEAFSAGRPSRLWDLPIQYADYAMWQREWLKGEVLDRLLSYWREELKGELSVLNMPTDFPRPAVQSYRGAVEKLEVSGVLVEELEELALREGATLFMVLLAALNVLLYRYTGQDEVIIGLPVANRERRETEGVVGFFANTVVFRADMREEPRFRDLLKRVKEKSIEVYSHQGMPFERLVEELNPERDLSRTPLFQVLFGYEGEVERGKEIVGLSMERMSVDSGVSRTDLSLWVEAVEDGLRCELEYSTDLFEAATMVRFLDSYEVLLASIVSASEMRIGKLPLLRGEERRRIVYGWNETEKRYGENRYVHDLFEQQVLLRPDNVAVVFGEHHLSYRELNRRAGRMATILRSAGVGPGTLVGVCLERSLEMVVGLMGIYKAGGSYLPLDPRYPRARVEFMLEDAGLAVVLTQRRLRGLFDVDKIRVVFVEEEEEGSGDVCELPRGERDGEGVAYVMYTSGSTGRPKGVVVLQRGVVNLLESMREELGIGETDCLLSVTMLSFDISVLELFLPLTVGARVVVAGEEGVVDGERLIGLLEEEGVTYMQGTPSTWRLLLEAGWKGSEGLTVLCGGEAWSLELAEQLLKRSWRVWNVYGPTETTVWSSMYRIRSAEGPMLVGRPIANTQMYILDERLEPVPVGVVGEICIGGDGVARWYLNREELTVHRFLENPFVEGRRSRMYKSGDLGRYRTDGTIECLGRIDHQVKVRGHRIELEEIEIVVAEYPGISQVVAVVREEGGGEKRIVAYVVGQDGNVGTEELRRYARGKLPEYMIPSFFVKLKTLPLTPNGKVDRGALPAPEAGQEQREGADAGPRNGVEEMLVQLWKEVLNLKEVGIRENFFHLGGHSLLALRLFARIEEAFGKKIPLAILIRAQTIELLAQSIQNDDWKPNWSALVQMQSQGSKPAFFLVHGAGGNILLYRDLVKLLGRERPVYGLQSPGLSGYGPVYTHIEEMAAHYIAEITREQPHGPYLLGGYCMGGLIAYEMAQQLRAGGKEIALVALFDTNISVGDLPFYQRAYQWMQRIEFHLRNILKAGKMGRFSFSAEKAREAERRFLRTLNVFLSQLFYKTHLKKNRPLVRLNQVNDRAMDEYAVLPYPGRVALFRSKRSYLGIDDELLGWSDDLTSDMEVYVLDIFPAGMLIEPFVAELADRLNDCIRDSLSAS